MDLTLDKRHEETSWPQGLEPVEGLGFGVSNPQNTEPLKNNRQPSNLKQFHILNPKP